LGVPAELEVEDDEGLLVPHPIAIASTARYAGLGIRRPATTPASRPITARTIAFILSPLRYFKRARPPQRDPPEHCTL
jgi:hypothetical protein